MEKKSYEYKRFDGFYEIGALNGNVTQTGGEMFAHIHVTLGDDSYHSIAGHLKEATAGATTEITITPLAAPVVRKFSPDIGMKLIVVDAK